MKWTADIHEHLLISVFQVTKFSGDQVKAILADMQARGYPITDRALTYVLIFSAFDLTCFCFSPA